MHAPQMPRRRPQARPGPPAWTALAAVFALVAAPPTTAQQGPQFHYLNGRCVNDAGEEGHNADYVGECGGLQGADLRDEYLEEINLAGADLRGARMNSAQLRGAVFRGAVLHNANLESADLRDADFGHASLERADLARADLTGALLEDVHMPNIILRAAILRDARLRDANMRGADLRGADLTGADLRGTRLNRALGDGRTVLPFTYTRDDLARRGMVFR